MTTTEEKKTYNGWTNYETWNVALWVDNDSSEYWRERAEDLFDSADADKSFTKKERGCLNLSAELKSDFEDSTPTITGCYADLLNAALAEVNWYEVAEHLIDAAVEEKEYK